MAKKPSIKSKTNEIKRLSLALIFLIIVVGGFILYLSWPLLTGTTIVLDTRPVDPFDPLRGQYMTINYKISSMPLIENVDEGDTVYVSLIEDENGIWDYNSASKTKPQSGVFIKGKVTSVRSSTMIVQYGIEQFFFERNAKVPTRGITVEAKVSSSGQARIVNLLQNGIPVNITYKEVKITS